MPQHYQIPRPVRRDSSFYLPHFLAAFVTMVTFLITPCLADGNSVIVQDDSTFALKIATWNVNRLQSTDTIRIQQIARKLRSVDADLYALQEVSSDTTLNNLLSYLKSEYRGFTASYIPYRLRLAYLYNTAKIDSLSTMSLPMSPDQKENWAYRNPFIFTFRVKLASDKIKRYTALNIHAKADIPDRYHSYQKRMRAADQLYRYLGQNHPSSHLITLGDFNDDIDRSIYQNQVSPYYLFRTDRTQYRIVTASLSDKQLSTTISHNAAIDHIILSDELFSAHYPKTLQRVAPFTWSPDSLPIDTLSDHYLVYTELHQNTDTPISKHAGQITSSDILKINQKPNPVHDYATFNLRLSKSRPVSLGIYNMAGQLISSIIKNQQLNRGTHSYRWTPPSLLANGMYYFLIKTEEQAPVSRPILLLR